MKNKLYVGIVTYGNRAENCIECMQTYFSKEIEYIIIANGVTPNSLAKLIQFAEDKNNINLNINEENLGSAGGFSTLIEEAKKKSDLSWLLILDDDSLVTFCIDDLIRLLFYKENIKPICSLYRPDRSYMKKLKDGSSIEQYFIYENSFLGFSIKRVLLKLFKNGDAKDNVLKWSTYSGLIIKDYILNNYDPPIRDFYLYADDTEYTYRISKKYGIDVLIDFEIRDTEGSWNVVKNENVFKRIIRSEFRSRLYYSLRNQSYIDNVIFKKSKLKYIVNLFVFNIILFLYLIKNINSKAIRNYKLYFRAVSEGRKGFLGKNNEFKI